MSSIFFLSTIRNLAVASLFVSSSLAQVKPRIAVFPFDDRTSSNKDMSIGTKVADLLIAKLTTNSAVTVYDRQYVDRILAEKDRKYDPNYDSAEAAKSGLLGTVDMVVSGQIDAFNANAAQVTSGKFVSKKVETDGSVELKVTARLISVEKGSVILAPIADAEEKGVLAKNQTYAPLVTKHLPGSKDALDVNQQQLTSSADQALRKLVDAAADEVSQQLATQVAQSAGSLPIQTAPPASPQKTESLHKGGVTEAPAFVGISDGLAYIDKGSEAGIKAGEKFVIRRNVDTGLKNGAGQPILRHKVICTLIISNVDQGSAAGKCIPDPGAHGTEGVPHAGDAVAAVEK